MFNLKICLQGPISPTREKENDQHHSVQWRCFTIVLDGCYIILIYLDDNPCLEIPITYLF